LVVDHVRRGAAEIAYRPRAPGEQQHQRRRHAANRAPHDQPRLRLGLAGGGSPA
jgi:hypothetical protein